MNKNHQTIMIEQDYRKWFAFSESVKSETTVMDLRKAILKKRSIGALSVSKGIDEERRVFYVLKESSENPPLKFIKSKVPELVEYLETHYIASGKIKKSSKLKMSGSQSEDHKQNTYSPYRSAILGKLVFLASGNKWKHSFIFSGIAFLFLQILVLNHFFRFADARTFDAVTGSFIALSLWFLCIRTYSFLYHKPTAYWDIFKLTFPYFSGLVVLWMIEASLAFEGISELSGILASVVLIIIGLAAALKLSFILSMITYYMHGGKMIKMS